MGTNECAMAFKAAFATRILLVAFCAPLAQTQLNVHRVSSNVFDLNSATASFHGVSSQESTHQLKRMFTAIAPSANASTTTSQPSYPFSRTSLVASIVLATIVVAVILSPALALSSIQSFAAQALITLLGTPGLEGKDASNSKSWQYQYQGKKPALGKDFSARLFGSFDATRSKPWSPNSGPGRPPVCLNVWDLDTTKVVPRTPDTGPDLKEKIEVELHMAMVEEGFSLDDSDEEDDWECEERSAPFVGREWDGPDVGTRPDRVLRLPAAAMPARKVLPQGWSMLSMKHMPTRDLKKAQSLHFLRVAKRRDAASNGMLEH